MQFSRNLKHILVIAMITLFAIFGVMRLFGSTFSIPITHFFVYRENIAPLNWLYTYHFRPSPDIAIIKIDDTTLNTLQAKSDIKTLTLSKSIYTDLIEKLEAVGVKGIAFDIVFQNVDPDEEKFASTLTRYPNVVIATTKDPKSTCIRDKNTSYETCDGIPRSIYRDATWGHIGIDSDGDRKIATVDISDLPYATWKKSREIDALSLALYKTTLDTTPVPYRTGASVLIPYFGPPGSYANISLSDVLSMSKVELVSNFAGKYVLVGEAGSLIHDAFESPVTGTLMDGVESHAHFLDGILQSRYLHAYTLMDIGYFSLVILFVLFMIAIYLSASKYVGLLVGALMVIWIIWMSRYAYASHAIVLEILPLLLAGSIFTFPITFIYRFFIVDREKRILTGAFSHYVDPIVVEEIGRNAHTISLGGESRELSILFSDIAGFTTLSEKLTPTDLFFMMSSYLSRMTDILTREGGTLDKYIGDAVMGFFGAPIPEVDHAVRACRTALEMREALPGFNSELLSRGLEAIDFRVGIGTGEVLVGNIGSHDRFNYTVLGDTVNLASRLEATSKEYGTRIIVSDRTYALAKESYLFRKLDTITVKGKNNSVAIYELIANISDNTIDRGPYTRYEHALDLYMAGDYLGAGKLWETQLDIDPPSQVMAHRCLDILKGDLTLEGGVYHMTKK